MAKSRGREIFKANVALFVRKATQAVYLKLVEDYSAEFFNAAFHRFTFTKATVAACSVTKALIFWVQILNSAKWHALQSS